MRVLFATAELAPLVKVGGLADASAGLAGALRSKGVDVDIVLPDYGDIPFAQADQQQLRVPEWASPATVRQGTLGGLGVSLVTVPGMARPHPYLDAEGRGWPDNSQRFLAFSMAVAAWVKITSPDVIHLNDWHTGATLGFLDDPPPSVLTIHNLAYQGATSGDWLERFLRHPDAYDRKGKINPLAGAITIADRVITVSPTFAA
ncbi:MAG: glycogen/starch synthase, partial [Acidimicrobiia bacterium]